MKQLSQFRPIQEWNDSFLALWSHRYDYLWAEHPDPKEPPSWQTESRYPLSDRLIKQGSYLYGVRFRPLTNYFMLDIDRGSLYHPSRDRLAWRRIMNCLEEFGWVKAIAVTSSYRGGLHLYFPFKQPQKTWAIALVVTTLLENAGFKLAPGQLEVFPNRKPYAPSGEHSLYNGHRLPMQAGSYLFNDDLQLIWGNQQTFVQYWGFAQQQNTVDEKAIDRIIKASRRQQYRITGKADKFLNDLNAEIERGWTGFGQTNRLLGRIAMRSYIFGHVLYADTPLEGEELAQDIVAIAQALPGYQDWCQHQHEIEQRAREWVSSIQQSHYFHYGKDKPSTGLPASGLTTGNNSRSETDWNKQQQSSARERIQKAIADLLEKEVLPGGITERFDALVTYGISGATLYRHRDLWHPQFLQSEPPNEGNSDLQSGAGQDCLVGASLPANHTNLLAENGCNSLPGETFSHLESAEQRESGCNASPLGDLSHLEGRTMTDKEGIAHIQQILKEVRDRRKVEQERRIADLEERSPTVNPQNWQS